MSTDVLHFPFSLADVFEKKEKKNKSTSVYRPLFHQSVPQSWQINFRKRVVLRGGVACVACVERGRGRGNLGARGRKERNACKDAIVFSIFYAQILSVKIVIGQN